MKNFFSKNRIRHNYVTQTAAAASAVLLSAVLLSAVAAAFFTSCSAFTQSFGAEYFGIDLSRDTDAAIENADIDTLTAALSNPAASENAAAIVVGLASQSTEDIQALDTSVQIAILNTTVAVALPTAALTEALAPLLTGGTEEEGAEETDTAQIISSVIESIPEVNTAAAAAVLSSPETLAEADITTVTFATVAVLAQIVRTETQPAEGDEVDTEDAADMLTAIQETFGTMEATDTPASLAAELTAAGTISAESQDLMETVLATVMVLSGTGNSGMTTDGTAVDRSADIADLEVFGFNIGSLLGLSVPESSGE